MPRRQQSNESWRALAANWELAPWKRESPRHIPAATVAVGLYVSNIPSLGQYGNCLQFD